MEIIESGNQDINEGAYLATMLEGGDVGAVYRYQDGYLHYYAQDQSSTLTVAEQGSTSLLLLDSDFELATGSHRTYQYLSDAPNPIPRSCLPMEIFELEHNGKSRTGLDFFFVTLEKILAKFSL